MIIYGARASNIANYEVANSSCTYCEQSNSQRISVFGKYAHIFWIPFFPLGKKAVAECTHCKRTIEQKEFTPSLLKQYHDNQYHAKTPKRHWFGVGIIGMLILFGSLIGNSVETDPRDAMLNADVNAMSSSPSMESDSISHHLQEMFNVFVNEEISPQEFEYLTKVRDDKALILMRIPKIKQVEKSSRLEVLEMMEAIVDNQADLDGKEKYIGIYGKYTIMMLKVGDKVENGRLTVSSPLYDFYGPKPPKEE